MNDAECKALERRMRETLGPPDLVDAIIYLVAALVLGALMLLVLA